MSLLNRVVATVLEALLWPFRGLPTLVGLAFVALLTAVVVLLVYRKTSDQGGITAVRRRIVASLLEMRLFRDDPVIVLRAQGQVLKASFRYFRYSLIPLAWILLPLVVLFIHLDRIYGHDPLAPGEAAILTVEAEEVGDLVLASGLGGIYPAGQVFGRVTHVDRKTHGPFQEIMVTPGNLSALEEVLIVKTTEMALTP